MSRRRPASRSGGHRRYPRTARVNEAMREVIAEELELLDDDRLELVTVTGVSADPDLRHATVWFSALTGPAGEVAAGEALTEHRVRLQAAVARQLQFRQTPLLQFTADPAITSGLRIEEILRNLPSRAADDAPTGDHLVEDGEA